jgi:hypothetical protein
MEGIISCQLPQHLAYEEKIKRQHDSNSCPYSVAIIVRNNYAQESLVHLFELDF